MMQTRLPIPARRSERGQAIVIIVAAVVVLLAITGLVVDGGMAYADRRQVQNAADSAALAAARALTRGDRSAAINDALQAAARNGYANDGEKSVVDVNIPPVDGPYQGNGQYIQIVITSHINTFFGSVINIRNMTNTVETIARAKPLTKGPIMNGYAVVSLAPNSNCMNDKAFWLHGQASLALQGGGLFVNSREHTCAFLQQGSGSLVVMDQSPVDIVGGASIQKLDLIKRLTYAAFDNRGEPNWDLGRPFLPNTGASPLSYPPPFVLPKVGCGSDEAKISDNGSTMSPGNWDDDFPPDGVTDLESGVYCIGGDFRVNGHNTLRGDNVVFVIKHGSVHFNGGATLQLSAPASGDLQGLLIYLPIDNHSVVVLNGNAQSEITGTILAPGSLIRFTGNDSTYGFHSQIIGYTIEADGDSILLVKYFDDQNFDTVNMPEVQLIK
jgi:hypothetical protein